MYSIYCDDICIYNDLSPEKEVRLIAPTVEWQDNAAGQLTFTMPECNVGYNKIVLMQSFIVVKKNNEEIWWGRPIKETRDFWKNKQITCEGALAFLNDVIQPQRMFEQNAGSSVRPPIYNFDGYPEGYLRVLIDYHNQNSNKYKFNLKKCTVRRYMVDEDDNDEYYSYIVVRTDFKNTLECISEKLINKEEIGGHIYCYRDAITGVFQIEYILEPYEDSVQKIEFGKNLLDFTQNFDDSKYCTVLYPRGESLGDSDVDGLRSYLELDPNADRNYTFSDDDHDTPITLRQKAPRLINESGVAAYGWIERVMDFSEAKDASTLLAKAGEWMTKNRFKDLELELKAFDLAYLNVEYQNIKFMQSVQVVSLPHGLNRKFPVLGITIPLDQPQNATYTLGKKKVESLSTYSSSVTAEVKKNQNWAEMMHDKDNNEIAKAFGEIQSAVDDYTTKIGKAVTDAQDYASQHIKSATRGRVNIWENQNGGDWFVIVDLPETCDLSKIDFTTLNKGMWVWNYNGLGYYPNGIHGDAKANVGITNQGEIIANNIEACEITANQIKGGKIEAGQIDSIYIDASWIKTGYIELTNAMYITSGASSGSKWKIKAGEIIGYYDNSVISSIKNETGFYDVDGETERWDTWRSSGRYAHAQYDHSAGALFYVDAYTSEKAFETRLYKALKNIPKGVLFSDIVSQRGWSLITDPSSLPDLKSGMTLSGDIIALDSDELWVKNVNAGHDYLKAYTGYIAQDFDIEQDGTMAMTNPEYEQIGIMFGDDHAFISYDGGSTWESGDDVKFYFLALKGWNTRALPKGYSTSMRKVINGVVV